jgi:arylsulfatase
MGLGAHIAQAQQIIRDAEYYVLESQNGEQWAAEDKEIDAKLDALRSKHGAPPNIVYVLWDDNTFGAVVPFDVKEYIEFEIPGSKADPDFGK